jgi:hypothetical protein
MLRGRVEKRLSASEFMLGRLDLGYATKGSGGWVLVLYNNPCLADSYIGFSAKKRLPGTTPRIYNVYHVLDFMYFSLFSWRNVANNGVRTLASCRSAWNGGLVFPWEGYPFWKEDTLMWSVTYLH